MSTTPIDPLQWGRLGRGRTYEFFCTDADMVRWFQSVLPTDIGPFFLIWEEIPRQGPPVVHQVPVSQFPTGIEGPKHRQSLFYLWSDMLCPLTYSKETESNGTYWGLSGLIQILHGGQHFYRRQPMGQAPSSIAIVERIGRVLTGQEIVHERGIALFNAFKRAIQRDLVYTTIQHFPDGTEHENTSQPLMTEDAVRQAGNGIRFSCQIGHPIGTRS